MIRMKKVPNFLRLFALLSTLVDPSRYSGRALTQPRVALISGANKGIGNEIARKFCAAGIATVVACRTNGKETAAELSCAGHCYLELRDDRSVADCAAYVRETFGRLDVLVNNAAVCFNDPTLYGRVPPAPFERQAEITVDTNFFGTRRLTSALLPLLERSDAPRIVNVASYAGRLAILRSPEKADLFADPSLGTDDLDRYMRDFVRAAEEGTHLEEGWAGTCYGMSKLGIIAYTRVLAREYPRMRVNSVDPGYCATDQNNNMGQLPASVGAEVPYLLATTEEAFSGKHWSYQGREIEW